MHIYCSKQHANTTGNRFCIQCGESLPLPQGEIIIGRYKILNQLGQGGFGRTYLAEDLQKSNQQSNQKCVLKEFAPQVEKPEDIRKAKELFEREANVLKKLQHPQIPKFHASLSTKFGQKDFFFLVQDYIEGDTYWDLLDKRLTYGQNGFSEDEVTLLLKQMLPVLSYIHSQDVIHRDISPDNIILRSFDNQPVLIDFGGVKQIPASQGFWMTQMGANRTLLGKKGYAPEEQLRQGKAFPCSDLYSLGVSTLVLISGKEPQNLYDSFQGAWRWGTEIKVSQGLEKILKKMVAYKPSDRYQNAEQVIKDLQKLSPVAVPAVNKVNTNVTKIKTMIAAPARRAGNLHSRTQMAVQTLPLPMWMRPLAVSAVTTTAIVLVCAGALGIVNAVVKGVSSISLPSISLPSLPSLPGGNSDSSSETTKSNSSSGNGNLASRRAALEIPQGFFTQTVNYIFYSRNPDLEGRNLSSGAEDEALRQQWLNIGKELLDKLEQANLSSDARKRLGSYSGQDYQTWKQKAEAGDFGKYTITQLNNDTNRTFDSLFPGQRRGKLNQPTFGQIWYAIAASKVSKLESN
ncbi:serine/threonine protein kinase [Calothrix sp. NIES-4071]|nr:serine/threonine protein kinase [Calothrix sp. NIES-4071]BAZ58694.1 serine/threonine protein kinase [Calothrix sp. NIES-4105]